jgi:hypothetical protein
MDTHKNAPLTPKGREMMVRAMVDGGLSKAAAARVAHPVEDRWQMGRAFPRRRRAEFSGPLLEASFLAEPNDVRRLGGG